jgi:hypothetical protein
MNNITAASPPRNSNPSSTASGPIVVGELTLNSRDVLRATIDRYEGHVVIDVRKFYRREDGTLGPTKKGLTVEISRLPALAEMIAAALERARTSGLLPAVSR